MIAVIVPNYNGRDLLPRCLDSLRAQTLAPSEIIVVDNNSSDDSLSLISQRFPEVSVVRLERNYGFAGAVNSGIRMSKSAMIAVLNNDAEADARWLEELAKALALRPEVGFCASKVYQLQDRRLLDTAGDCLLRGGIGYKLGHGRSDAEDLNRLRFVIGASGVAALYRRQTLEEIGLFDEDFFAYLEDIDLSLRAQLFGYQCLYVPTAIVYHYGGATSGGEFSSSVVYLKTRNALWLLCKNYPLSSLLRSLPMILCYQLCWFGRVLRRGRLAPYLKGMAAALIRLPRMLNKRGQIMRRKRLAPSEFYRLLLESESQAARDFLCRPDPSRYSRFLHLYFKFFDQLG